MKRFLVLTCALLLAVAVAVACGDGDGSNSGQPAGTIVSGTPGTGVATVPPDEDPTDFVSLRDPLVERLDSIGVSVGFVPEDIQDELLATCRHLELFADEDAVDEICTGLEDAMSRGDPGLLDVVVRELKQLEED